MVKYDNRIILIVVFLVSTFLFGYKWYFGSNGDKTELRELNKKYTELELEKRKSDIKISKIDKDYNESVRICDELKKQVYDAEMETKKAIIISNKSKKKLDDIKLVLSKIEKEIELFKKTPPNREGDSLLISIKNHTK